MAKDTKRARSRGREREIMPATGRERDAGKDAADNSLDAGEAAGDGTVDPGRDPVPSPPSWRELLQAGQVRFDQAVGLDDIGRPGAGQRAWHPVSKLRTLLVPDVAAYVASVDGDEDVRRWCLLTLAGALGAGTVTSSGSWRLDMRAGVIAFGSPPARRGDRRAIERYLPGCALHEAGTWIGPSWRGPSPDRVRGSFERYRRTEDVPWISPGSLRRFVIEQLACRAPDLFPDDVAAWLGLCPQRGRLHRKGWFRPDIPAVLQAMDALLRDIDRQSGGVLLRAGGRAATHH